VKQKQLYPPVVIKFRKIRLYLDLLMANMIFRPRNSSNYISPSRRLGYR
jgi:hypothetical protein